MVRDYSPSGVLPFRYLFDLLLLLKTYEFVDFMDCSAASLQPAKQMRTESDLKAFYEQEHKVWKATNLNRRRIEINILQDCDHGVIETEEMCAFEAAFGIKSTTALFARRGAEANDRRQYEIDFGHMALLQRRGLLFSYHSNAWEMSGFDEVKHVQTFNEDLAFLEAQGLQIDCFSPHGARPSPDGRHNSSFFHPAFASKPLVWTHNRIAPWGARYGDGDLWPRLRRGDLSTDFRAYLLKHLAWGRRLWILFHPQFYSGFNADVANRESVLPWTAEYWHGFESGRPLDFWQPVRRHLDQLAAKDAKAHAV